MGSDDLRARAENLLGKICSLLDKPFAADAGLLLEAELLAAEQRGREAERALGNQMYADYDATRTLWLNGIRQP